MIAAAESLLPAGWLLIASAAFGLATAALGITCFLLSQRKLHQLKLLTAQPSRSDDALAQLREARDQASKADRANRTKSAFLAKMSHELRTPLSAIIGYAELIEQESVGPIGNPKYACYAGDIRQSGRHLLRIINDILDLSKVESGHETLREQTFLVEELLTAVRVLLEGRPQEANVELVFDCPDDLPAIRADRGRLTQILVNLLSNGIKFTPQGGTVRLSCRATEASGFVFEVTDNGIGIAQEDISRALSVFGQIDSGTGYQTKGTGLGLPLAKALAELHGGTLDLQSERGEGTTATLRLPPHRIVARPGPAIRAEGAEDGRQAMAI